MLRTKARDTDLVAAGESVLRLARRMRMTVPALRIWDAEDLAQEVFLKALVKIGAWEGKSTLKTWVFAVAKNHLLTMARAASLRPRSCGDLVLEKPARIEEDRELWDEAVGLVGWLREEGRELVPWGWRVLNLLLQHGGNYARVAGALARSTGVPWTVEAVREVVGQIRQTPRGRELAGDCGTKKEA